MKSDNKWIYVVGVAVLAVLVIIGVMWGGGDTAEAPDAGAEAGAEAGATESDGGTVVATSDGGASGSTDDDAAATGPAADDPGETPTDPDACRARCRRLAEAGDLAAGATAESCIAGLCSGEEAEDEESDEEEDEAASSQPEPPPEVEPEIPDLPEDCQASCRMMQQRGELAAGTSLEACYAAMCGSEESEEETE